MPVSLNLGPKPAEPELTQEEALDQTQQTTLDPEVDELARLLDWQAKQKKDPKQVRLEELKAKFATAAETMTGNGEVGPDDEIVFEGVENKYVLGAQANTRTVTPEGKMKFANKVGEEAFLQVATVPLKAIDDYIPKLEQPEYLETSRGSRSGKVQAKLVAKKK